RAGEQAERDGKKGEEDVSSCAHTAPGIKTLACPRMYAGGWPYCAGRSPQAGPLALRFIRPPASRLLRAHACTPGAGRIALVDPRKRGPSPFASYGPLMWRE